MMETIALYIEVFGDLQCLRQQGVEDIDFDPPKGVNGEPGIADFGHNRLHIRFYVDLYGGVDWRDVISGDRSAMGPDVRGKWKPRREEDYENAVLQQLPNCDRVDVMAEDWQLL